ncbi:MAG: hypothetical protein HY231_18900 [Acidobacteria bacterium]|nr:hypothetical protein [Acidobacteriota bacterium]
MKRLPIRLQAFLFHVSLALLLAAVMQSVATPVTAQAAQSLEWQNLTPATGARPEARRNGAAIYDPVDHRLVVFGGTGQNGLLNDVWAFNLDTLTWTRLNTTGTAPDPRLGHDAIYDPIGQQMVIWAGQQGSKFFNDTWALSLRTLEWRNLSPTSGRPKARYGSAAVYDPVAQSLVQFAGFTEEGRRFQDTQNFNLASQSWTDLTPAGSKPEIRCLLTGALDRTARRMIIYGGQRNGPLDDLWAYDLASRSWTELTPASRPAGRFFASSFVNREGRFVVFGGSTPTGNSNDSYAFDFQTGQWSSLELAAPPSARNGMMSAYDEAEDRFLVFGGTSDSGLLNDVWQLKNTKPTPLPLPQVSSASIVGKALFVLGENFANGAVILVAEQEQGTRNDAQSPATMLISKKGGKKIKVGQAVTIQVRNPNGVVSAAFSFTRLE